MINAAWIAHFLKEAHPSTKEGVEDVLRSHDLYADGWLDSLLTLQLINRLEEEAGLRVPPFLVTRRQFASVAAIEELVVRLRHERS